MGFKDGTMNVNAEDPAAIDAHVWVPADTDPRALAGQRLLSGGASHQHDRRDLGPAAAE
jgi:hypothetical protein